MFFLAVLMLLTCLFPDSSQANSPEPRLPGNALSPWGDKGLGGNGFPAGTIIIRITGLDPPSGVLRLALYDSRKSYEERRDPIRSAAVEIAGTEAVIKFDGLPPGSYAVMMYHDTNRNNKFDRILGLPKEQYGFSNNARPGLGPPDFDKVKFPVRAGKVTFITIRAQ